MPEGKDEVDWVKIHVRIERELYEALWEITKERFIVPVRRFYIVLNDAIKEYVEKWRSERGEREGDR